MDTLLILADVAPLPGGLPPHVWWRLLAGVIGLAAVGAILVALLFVSFRRAHRTVREARAEHAALSEQLLADARAEGARAEEARAAGSGRRESGDEE
jgi:hypothetical protein